MTEAASTVTTVEMTEDQALARIVQMLVAHMAKRTTRVAFAGGAGAGKTTLCELIAGTSKLLAPLPNHPKIPIFNHADGIKDEVLTWVARAWQRRLIPYDPRTEDIFLEEHWGFTPAMTRAYAWELMGPLCTAMSDALEAAYEQRWDLSLFASYEMGYRVEEKVAFVDKHKPYFRRALQLYGEATKELNANEFYWVDQTITRSQQYRGSAVNGDTRYTAEVKMLSAAAWTTIYLDISPEVQAIRRPDLTAELLSHSSENGMQPEDCDLIINADDPLVVVAINVYNYLTGGNG